MWRNRVTRAMRLTRQRLGTTFRSSSPQRVEKPQAGLRRPKTGKYECSLALVAAIVRVRFGNDISTMVGVRRLQINNASATALMSVTTTIKSDQQLALVKSILGQPTIGRGTLRAVVLALHSSQGELSYELQQEELETVTNLQRVIGTAKQ